MTQTHEMSSLSLGGTLLKSWLFSKTGRGRKGAPPRASGTAPHTFDGVSDGLRDFNADPDVELSCS